MFFFFLFILFFKYFNIIWKLNFLWTRTLTSSIQWLFIWIRRNFILIITYFIFLFLIIIIYFRLRFFFFKWTIHYLFLFRLFLRLNFSWTSQWNIFNAWLTIIHWILFRILLKSIVWFRLTNTIICFIYWMRSMIRLINIDIYFIIIHHFNSLSSRFLSSFLLFTIWTFQFLWWSFSLFWCQWSWMSSSSWLNIFRISQHNNFTLSFIHINSLLHLKIKLFSTLFKIN